MSLKPREHRRSVVVFLFAASLLVTDAMNAEPAANAEDSLAFSAVKPLLQKHCAGCHGSAKPKGDLRLDQLNPDMVKGNDGDRWREVLDRLNLGDMPPESEPPLPAADRERIVRWLVQERKRESLAKNPDTHFRRLTRREYERTMQDLLRLPIDFANRLPEDGRSKDGFLNNGEMLRISPLQYEMYFQIAEEALAEAIVEGQPPEVHRYRLAAGLQPGAIDITSLDKPDNHVGESFNYFTKPNKQGAAFRIWNLAPSPKKEKDKEVVSDGTLPPAAIQRYSEAAVKLPQHCFAVGFHRAFRKGEASIRVRVARVEPAKETSSTARVPTLAVAIGSTNFHGVELKLVGEALPIEHTDFKTREFRVRMESMPAPNTSPPADKNATVLALWNSARAVANEADPPRLKIEWVEFETPLLEAWPPPSHSNILFPNNGGWDEATYASEVIHRFATRAYRRPLAKAELDRLVKYWSTTRKNAESLEASLRDTLSVLLSSSQFLALPASRAGTGSKERVDDHELASRLSYFLWSTMPDDTLRTLADQKRLREPATLGAEVRRMIRDPKSWQFVEQFTEQWLELDRLQRVTVQRDRYPGFDDELATAMRLESLHFFAELLRNDLSIFQILDSDFTCLNETLAAHYGVVGVSGPQFRRVALEPSHHRGGMLTHASVLTGNSDGIDGHPIKRGIWLLKNLLDETPPPPPPNVPELSRNDPKVKGLTIPQALAAHRESNACVGCHRKIDPWGLAFEEYDAVGNWQRDGRGADLRKKRTKHPLDATAELPTGVKVDGLRDLQAELARSKSDAFRRAVLRKVLAYGLGRTLTLSDVEAADKLAPQLQARGDKLGALIELVVASDVFQAK